MDTHSPRTVDGMHDDDADDDAPAAVVAPAPSKRSYSTPFYLQPHSAAFTSARDPAAITPGSVLVDDFGRPVMRAPTQSATTPRSMQQPTLRGVWIRADAAPAMHASAASSAIEAASSLSATAQPASASASPSPSSIVIHRASSLAPVQPASMIFLRPNNQPHLRRSLLESKQLPVPSFAMDDLPANLSLSATTRSAALQQTRTQLLRPSTSPAVDSPSASATQAPLPLPADLSGMRGSPAAGGAAWQPLGPPYSMPSIPPIAREGEYRARVTLSSRESLQKPYITPHREIQVVQSDERSQARVEAEEKTEDTAPALSARRAMVDPPSTAPAAPMHAPIVIRRRASAEGPLNSPSSPDGNGLSPRRRPFTTVEQRQGGSEGTVEHFPSSPPSRAGATRKDSSSPVRTIVAASLVPVASGAAAPTPRSATTIVIRPKSRPAPSAPSAASLASRMQQTAIVLANRPPSPLATEEEEKGASGNTLAPASGSLRGMQRPRRALAMSKPNTAATVAAPAGAPRGSVLMRADYLAELSSRSKLDTAALEESTAFRHSFLFVAPPQKAIEAALRKRRAEAGDGGGAGSSSESDGDDDEATDDIRPELTTAALGGSLLSARRPASEMPLLHPASTELARMDPSFIASDHSLLHAHLAAPAVDPAVFARDLGVVEAWLTEMAVKFQRKMEGDSAVNNTAATSSAAGAAASGGAGWRGANDPDAASARHADMAVDTAGGSYQSPLDRMAIGRRILLKAGMSDELATRCYVDFFAYSVGLYDAVASCIRHVSRRQELLAVVWVTYLSALENAEPSLYSWVLEVVRTENARREDLRRQEHAHRVSQVKAHVKNLRNKVSVMALNDSVMTTQQVAEDETLANLGSTLREMQHQFELGLERKAAVQTAIAESTIHAFEMEATASWQGESLHELIASRAVLAADIAILVRRLATSRAAVAQRQLEHHRLNVEQTSVSSDIARLDQEVCNAQRRLSHLADNASGYTRMIHEEQTKLRELDEQIEAQGAYMAALAKNGLHMDLSPSAQDSWLRKHMGELARARLGRSALGGMDNATTSKFLLVDDDAAQDEHAAAEQGEMQPRELERRGLSSQAAAMLVLKQESVAKTADFELQAKLLREELAQEEQIRAQRRAAVDSVRAEHTALTARHANASASLSALQSQHAQVAGSTSAAWRSELKALEHCLKKHEKEREKRVVSIADKKAQLAELLAKMVDLSMLEENRQAALVALQTEALSLHSQRVALESSVSGLSATLARKSRHLDLLRDESRPLLSTYQGRLEILQTEWKLHEQEKGMMDVLRAQERRVVTKKEEGLQMVQEQIAATKIEYDRTTERSSMLAQQILADDALAKSHEESTASTRSITAMDQAELARWQEIRVREVADLETSRTLAQSQLEMSAALEKASEEELAAGRSLNYSLDCSHAQRMGEVEKHLRLKKLDLGEKARAMDLARATIDHATGTLQDQLAKAQEDLKRSEELNASLMQAISDAHEEASEAVSLQRVRGSEIEAERVVTEELQKLHPFLLSQLDVIQVQRRAGERAVESTLNAELGKQKLVVLDITALEAAAVERLVNAVDRGVQAHEEDAWELRRAALKELVEKEPAPNSMASLAPLLDRFVMQERSLPSPKRAPRPAADAASPWGPGVKTIIPTQFKNAPPTTAAAESSPTQSARTSPAVSRPASQVQQRPTSGTVQNETSALDEMLSRSQRQDSRAEASVASSTEAPATPSAVQSDLFSECTETLSADAHSAFEYTLVVDGEDVLLQPGDELVQEQPESSSSDAAIPERSTARRFVRRATAPKSAIDSTATLSSAAIAPPVAAGAPALLRPVGPSTSRVLVTRFDPRFFAQPESGPVSASAVKNAPGSLLQGEHHDIEAVLSRPTGASSRASPSPPPSVPSDRPVGYGVEPLIRRIRLLPSADQAPRANSPHDPSRSTASASPTPPLRPYLVVAAGPTVVAPQQRFHRNKELAMQAAAAGAAANAEAISSSRPSSSRTRSRQGNVSTTTTADNLATIQRASTPQQTAAPVETAPLFVPERVRPDNYHVAGFREQSKQARLNQRRVAYLERQEARADRRCERAAQRFQTLKLMGAGGQQFGEDSSGDSATEPEPTLSSSSDSAAAADDDDVAAVDRAYHQLLNPVWKQDFSATQTMRQANTAAARSELTQLEMAEAEGELTMVGGFARRGSLLRASGAGSVRAALDQAAAAAAVEAAAKARTYAKEQTRLRRAQRKAAQGDAHALVDLLERDAQGDKTTLAQQEWQAAVHKHDAAELKKAEEEKKAIEEQQIQDAAAAAAADIPAAEPSSPTDSRDGTSSPAPSASGGSKKSKKSGGGRPKHVRRVSIAAAAGEEDSATKARKASGHVPLHVRAGSISGSGTVPRKFKTGSIDLSSGRGRKPSVDLARAASPSTPSPGHQRRGSHARNGSISSNPAGAASPLSTKKNRRHSRNSRAAMSRTPTPDSEREELARIRSLTDEAEIELAKEALEARRVERIVERQMARQARGASIDGSSGSESQDGDEDPNAEPEENDAKPSAPNQEAKDQSDAAAVGGGVPPKRSAMKKVAVAESIPTVEAIAAADPSVRSRTVQFSSPAPLALPAKPSRITDPTIARMDLSGWVVAGAAGADAGANLADVAATAAQQRGNLMPDMPSSFRATGASSSGSKAKPSAGRGKGAIRPQAPLAKPLTRVEAYATTLRSQPQQHARGPRSRRTTLPFGHKASAATARKCGTGGGDGESVASAIDAAASSPTRTGLETRSPGTSPSRSTSSSPNRSSSPLPLSREPTAAPAPAGSALPFAPQRLKHFRAAPAPPPSRARPAPTLASPSALILFDDQFFERSHAEAVSEVARETAWAQQRMMAAAAASHQPAPPASAAPSSRPYSRARSRTASRAASRSTSRGDLREGSESDVAEDVDADYRAHEKVRWESSVPRSRSTSPARAKPALKQGWAAASATAAAPPPPLVVSAHSTSSAAASSSTASAALVPSELLHAPVFHLSERSFEIPRGTVRSNPAAAPTAAPPMREMNVLANVSASVAHRDRPAGSQSARRASTGASVPGSSSSAAAAVPAAPLGSSTARAASSRSNSSWQSLRPVPWPSSSAAAAAASASRPRTSGGAASSLSARPPTVSRTGRSTAFDSARVPDFIKRSAFGRATADLAQQAPQ